MDNKIGIPAIAVFGLVFLLYMCWDIIGPRKSHDVSFKGHVLGTATLADFQKAFPDGTITDEGKGIVTVFVTTTSYADHPCTALTTFVDGVLASVAIRVETSAKRDVLSALEQEYGKPGTWGVFDQFWRLTGGTIFIPIKFDCFIVTMLHDLNDEVKKRNPPSTDL